MRCTRILGGAAIDRAGVHSSGTAVAGVLLGALGAAAGWEVAQQFFAEVNKQAKPFMSDEHFTVDGTLIQAWASQKSFRRKDGSDGEDGTNFHGEKRSNKTHASTTDVDARLYKKSLGEGRALDG